VTTLREETETVVDTDAEDTEPTVEDETTQEESESADVD